MICEMTWCICGGFSQWKLQQIALQPMHIWSHGIFSPEGSNQLARYMTAMRQWDPAIVRVIKDGRFVTLCIPDYECPLRQLECRIGDNLPHQAVMLKLQEPLHTAVLVEMVSYAGTYLMEIWYESVHIYVRQWDPGILIYVESRTYGISSLLRFVPSSVTLLLHLVQVFYHPYLKSQADLMLSISTTGWFRLSAIVMTVELKLTLWLFSQEGNCAPVRSERQQVSIRVSDDCLVVQVV